jgi:GNAT superfamily N-acetyltransferase
MYTIRLAHNSDLEQLKLIKPSITTETVQERLALQIKQKAEFFVVDTEKELAGFALLKWFGKPTHPEYPDIEDLYIKESYRGKGLATMLLQECEKKAKDKGVTKIGIAVNPSENCPAKKLYLKCGYTHDGKPEYIDGIYNGVEDWAIDLEKSL